MNHFDLSGSFYPAASGLVCFVSNLCLCRTLIWHHWQHKRASLQKSFRKKNIFLPLTLPAISRIYFLLLVWRWCGIFRDVEAKAASMCGPLETAVAMTTATAMAMLQVCGQSPSTQPSMTAAQPCMTRAAPPPWPPHSATAARGTQRLEWWVLKWAKVPPDWKLH